METTITTNGITGIPPICFSNLFVIIKISKYAIIPNVLCCQATWENIKELCRMLIEHIVLTKYQPITNISVIPAYLKILLPSASEDTLKEFTNAFLYLLKKAQEE
jgi:hypothetical protein